MTLKLYLAKQTIAYAVQLALEECGAAHELVWLDFAGGEQTRAPYGGINPKRRVPALVTPQGTLTETQAILGWLDTQFPVGGLMPGDPWQRARVDEMNLYLASTMHVAHAHKQRGSRWSDDPDAIQTMRDKVAANMAASAAYIDQDVLTDSGPWVLGDIWSAADIYLFTVCRWLARDKVDIADYPRLTAHHAAMLERPATARVEAMHG